METPEAPELAGLIPVILIFSFLSWHSAAFSAASILSSEFSFQTTGLLSNAFYLL
jgi:hypothetical protein